MFKGKVHWSNPFFFGYRAVSATGILLIGVKTTSSLQVNMAKAGQGSDRWIVKEREDGTNVNNWHVRCAIVSIGSQVMVVL